MKLFLSLFIAFASLIRVLVSSQCGEKTVGQPVAADGIMQLHCKTFIHIIGHGSQF
jgi:hypothetical protein